MSTFDMRTKLLLLISLQFAVLVIGRVIIHDTVLEEYEAVADTPVSSLTISEHDSNISTDSRNGILTIEEASVGELNKLHFEAAVSDEHIIIRDKRCRKRKRCKRAKQPKKKANHPKKKATHPKKKAAHPKKKAAHPKKKTTPKKKPKSSSSSKGNGSNTVTVTQKTSSTQKVIVK